MVHLKTILTLCSLAPLLFCLSCSPKPEKTDDGRIIINLWLSWAGFEKDAMDTLIADYHKQQDKVFIKSLNISDPAAKIMLATASGHPPDLALLHFFNIPAYAENNALTPLNRLSQKHGVKKEDFIDVAWEACSYKDFVWAIPITASTTTLHYNKKIFRELSIDPANAFQSLETLEAANEKILQRREDGSIERIGHMPNEPGWWQTEWIRWFGGHSWNRDDQMTIDSPEWIATGKWIQSYPDRFGANDITKLKSGFGKFASPQNPFFTGKLAMVIQGAWMDNFIRNYAPEGFEYGIAPFPASEKSSDPFVSLFEPDSLIIPKGSKHPEEAFAFIAFLVQQENLEKLALLHRKFTSLKKVSKTFVQNHPHPYIEDLIEIANSPYTQSRFKSPQFQSYQDDMVNAVTNIIAGRSEPEEELAKAQRAQQKALDQTLKRWNRVAKKRVENWNSQ